MDEHGLKLEYIEHGKWVVVCMCGDRFLGDRYVAAKQKLEDHLTTEKSVNA